ncbi:MAG: hypothetical protein M1467_03950 [Deltaproteobacteria bacterium]|nr:hypothetical protein [Deltaproteobacteria bacterium]
MNFEDSEYYKKIFVFHNSYPDRIISRESGRLGFKEFFNWGSKDEYAKTYFYSLGILEEFDKYYRK